MRLMPFMTRFCRAVRFRHALRYSWRLAWIVAGRP